MNGFPSRGKEELMMKKSHRALCILALLTAVLISSGAEARDSFDRLKSLSGTWAATFNRKGKTDKVMVEYQVTSGGNAVLEKLYAGAAHEMVSVYYRQGTEITLTHYSIGQGTSQLDLLKGTDRELRFGPAGENSGVDLHSLEIQWTDEDHIVRRWTSLKRDKQVTSALRLTREGASSLEAGAPAPAETLDSQERTREERPREEKPRERKPAKRKTSATEKLKGAWKAIIGD